MGDTSPLSDLHDRTAIGLQRPIGGQQHHAFGHSLGDQHPVKRVGVMSGGTRTVGVVRCDQPRALDMRARKGRKIESIPEAIMD